MPIKPLLLNALEAAFERYLAMDPDSRQFLAPLAGKVIAITFLPFSETIYLCPSDDGIRCIDIYQQQPDTQITGSILALSLMGLGSNPMRSVFSGEVKIDGDIQTGRAFQALFAKVDPHWEEKLSQITGDVVAHRCAVFFRKGRRWGQDSVESFRLNIKEYLQEELQDLPAESEVSIHHQRTDTLRLDLDRLAARIDRLNKVLTVE